MTSTVSGVYDPAMVVSLLLVALALVAFLAVGAAVAGPRSSRARSVLSDLGALGVAADPARFAPVCGDARLRFGLPGGP